MKKVKFILSFLSLTLCFGVLGKNNKPDVLLEIQGLINQAYKLGYVDAAPVEMGFIEKKVIAARTAREKRKHKTFDQLVAEMKADLTIVKQRYLVNQLHNQLAELEQANSQSKKMLEDLTRQLK